MRHDAKTKWMYRLVRKLSPWAMLFKKTVRRITDFGPDYGIFLKSKKSNE